MQIPEISSETTANESVKRIQKAPKRITNFFVLINDEKSTIEEICRKAEFENIELREKRKE